MPYSDAFPVQQWLLLGVVMNFLVWSLIGIAMGAGLIVASAQTIRLFGKLNRYVSTRHGLKALAVTHDIEPGVYRHRRLVGACFVLGAALSAYGLIAWFNSGTFVAALGLDYPAEFVAWIVESVRWFLLVFAGFGIVIGILLGFYPALMKRLEAYMNRWYSTRHAMIGLETMHFPLDRLVLAFPRSVGIVLVIAALYVAANAAVMWLKFRQ